ncbi:MAG TPA: hypothetical protein VH143_18560 [Kofleriaceae bacterium]|jgi:hypothetical protein|nr:hypothetical protein [Kofleriaceae bacterium]
MQLRWLGACVVVSWLAAGIAAACPDFDKAGALLAKAFPGRDSAIEQCAIVAVGPSAAWAIAARDGATHHLAVVGGDGALLADAPLEDAAVFAIRPVDLDGDGADELAVETHIDGAAPRAMLHLLRRDHAKLVELVAVPIAFTDSGTTCNGTWLVRGGAVVVMGDGGSGAKAKAICQAGSTELKLAGGKLVQTKLDPAASAVVWTRHYRDVACGCATEACARAAGSDLDDWKSRHKPKLGDAQTREVAALGNQLARCTSIAAAMPDALSNGSFADAMVKMEQFETEMCACKDSKCAQKVSDEMAKWSQEMAKGNRIPPKMSDDDVKRATAIGEAMGKCMQKAMGAGN